MKDLISNTLPAGAENFFHKGYNKDKKLKPILFNECSFCKEEFTCINTRRKFCSTKCRKNHFEHNNLLRRIFQKTKSRAKKEGIEFTLKVGDLKIPEYCPALGIKLYREFGVKNHPNSPSIDRIDPSKGYVSGNVQIISWRANQLKSNGTLEEFEKLVKWMKNQT